MSRIVILGAGAWGTALSMNLANRGGHEVTLWSHSSAAAAAMRECRENATYLPSFHLPTEIVITSDPEEAVREAKIIVSVVPSEHLRATYERFAPLLRSDQTIVSGTKGLEDRTLLRMSEVIHETLGNRNISLPCG